MYDIIKHILITCVCVVCGHIMTYTQHILMLHWFKFELFPQQAHQLAVNAVQIYAIAIVLLLIIIHLLL